MKPEIKKALDRCRAAFAKHPDASWVWCCHHEMLCEKLTEPAENRIKYILSDKPEHEQEARFNNFRPVRDLEKFTPLYAEYQKQCDTLAFAEYQKQCAPLYAEYQKQCDTLYAEYQKKRATLYAEYQKQCDTLYAEYQKQRAPLYAEYQKQCATLYAEYQKQRAPLYAEYQKQCDTLQKPFKKLYKQDVPLGTWNGKSIFK